MTRQLWALLRRDLTMLVAGGRRGATVLPVLFFLAVAMLFPFAVGPDPVLLARTGGGVIWVAALLAAILPLDRLKSQDRCLMVARAHRQITQQQVGTGTIRIAGQRVEQPHFDFGKFVARVCFLG